MRIHLLHTNDVHSQLENFMRLGCRLRRIRDDIQALCEPVFTFDIGDVLDRVRPETEATMGLVNVDLMAALRYDGWVFGNNEGLTIQSSVWAELVDRAKTITFGTNLRNDVDAQFPFFEDHHIYEQNGVKIGVFGLTADYHEPYENLGVRVKSPTIRAHETVNTLKKLGADIVILLSHLGLWEDRKLAGTVPGIHLILGGHTHNFMDGAEWVGQTAIFQSGKHALAFGHTVIEFNESTRCITSITSTPVSTELHGTLDPQMESVFLQAQPYVREKLSEPVAELDVALPVRYDGESPFANVLADVLYEAYPCDFSIIMSGALTASLLPGRVRLTDIHAACSSPTRPLLMTLRGSEIVSILTKALTSEFFNRNGYGYGFRGSVVGWLALSNAEVTLRRCATSGICLLDSIHINGRLIDTEREYRLVTSEYLWLSPVFEEFHKGEDISIEPPLVREVLLQKMGDPGRIKKANQARYQVK